MEAASGSSPPIGTTPGPESSTDPCKLAEHHHPREAGGEGPGGVNARKTSGVGGVGVDS